MRFPMVNLLMLALVGVCPRPAASSGEPVGENGTRERSEASYVAAMSDAPEVRRSAICEALQHRDVCPGARLTRDAMKELDSPEVRSALVFFLGTLRPVDSAVYKEIWLAIASDEAARSAFAGMGVTELLWGKLTDAEATASGFIVLILAKCDSTDNEAFRVRCSAAREACMLRVADELSVAEQMGIDRADSTDAAFQLALATRGDQGAIVEFASSFGLVSDMAAERRLDLLRSSGPSSEAARICLAVHESGRSFTRRSPEGLVFSKSASEFVEDIVEEWRGSPIAAEAVDSELRAISENTNPRP